MRLTELLQRLIKSIACAQLTSEFDEDDLLDGMGEEVLVRVAGELLQGEGSRRGRGSVHGELGVPRLPLDLHAGTEGVPQQQLQPRGEWRGWQEALKEAPFGLMVIGSW